MVKYLHLLKFAKYKGFLTMRISGIPEFFTYQGQKYYRCTKFE